MATVTLYPVAGANSPCDGTVLWSGSQTVFAVVRGQANATVSDVTNTSGTILLLESGSLSNDYDTLSRAVFNFDTSSLGAGAVVTSAVLSLYVTSKQNNMSQSVGVTSATPASTANLVNGDYLVTHYGSTRFATDKTITSVTTSAYNDWTLNASGIAAINVTGVTTFAFRLSCDIDNAAPTWASGVQASIDGDFADNGANEPKLVVTYTVPAATGNFAAFF